MADAKYYVYLLRSETYDLSYVGYTVDITRRVDQHNGKLSGGGRYTQGKGPWEVVIYAQFQSSKSALSTEYKIKHSRKSHKSAKVMKSDTLSKRIGLFLANCLLHQEDTGEIVQVVYVESGCDEMVRVNEDKITIIREDKNTNTPGPHLL